jgi:hypothetical protein|tara:strand:+ start:169 stop:726 length:558 start_codon:yes stop_codon:yes gene_type:complete
MRQIKIEGDGAHCGLADWYPPIEAQIKECLVSGVDFTTGWYASKKEIASACITSTGGSLLVEVSVSDDFDCVGTTDATIPTPATLEEIREEIYRVWESAEEAQKDNSCVVYWTIKDAQGRFVEVYLQAVGWGEEMDEPPGDYYFQWGFQGFSELPADLRAKIEERIYREEYTPFTIDGYKVAPAE